MPFLRHHATFIARWVLVWLCLAMGAAVASPLVNPQSIDLVCSASGAIKVVVQGEDGAQEMPSHTLDCPLCVHLGAPPPVAQAQLPVVHPLAHALQPIAAAHIAARTAAPLPPRGPPLVS